MSDPELQREVGRLGGVVESMGASVDDLRGEVRGMRDEIKQVIGVANQVKGGWRALLSVAGVAGTVGSAITALVMKFKGLS